MNRPLVQGLAALAALAGLAVSGSWRARPPAAPPRVPAAQAEAWMADCLPGIGAKRREQAAAAIRSGDLAALPPAARAAARELFSGL